MGFFYIYFNEKFSKRSAVVMKWLVVIFLLFSCSSVGPNYNQGRSHDESMSMRHKIIVKEDARVKKQMKKSRASGRRSILKSRNHKSKSTNKYIR